MHTGSTFFYTSAFFLSTLWISRKFNLKWKNWNKSGISSFTNYVKYWSETRFSYWVSRFLNKHTTFWMRLAVESPGATPIYKLCRYVPPYWAEFLRHFNGLKRDIHFAPFGLESGMVFEGTTGLYERLYRFNFKWVRKKEKYANSKWLWRIFLFAL